MKICKIYIKGFQQFQDVELDFTNPETGEPLDKICFIGSNGTGKSKILRIIAWFFSYLLKSLYSNQSDLLLGNDDKQCKMIFRFQIKNTKYILFYFDNNVELIPLNKKTERECLFIISNLKSLNSIDQYGFISEHAINKNEIENEVLIKDIIFKDNSNDLVVFSPAESSTNGYLTISDIPNTTVGEALKLFLSSPFFNIVTPDTFTDFWKLLIYNLKARDDQRQTFEILPENINKTKAQLIKEFDGISPKILDKLNEVWNRILDKCGLEFDVVGASNPIQLNENLKAYVRLKASKKALPYSELSKGIRDYIFRVGHIFSLYFNKKIDRGILLIDEPENSLYPDFLFDLVNIYQQIIIDKRGENNTQMFFATHNPIIASQFKPYERIILEWNDDGSVSAKKGITPEGDDPNDILVQDFEVRELMTSKGVEIWNKYLQMKNDLKKASTKEERFKLASEISKIGLAYNFPE